MTEPNPLSLEEPKAKSLGEKLCEATRPFPGCWESLTEESRCIYEQTALRSAASLTHDETASAIIASLRAALEEAEGRNKAKDEAIRAHLCAREALEETPVQRLRPDDERFKAVSDTLAGLRSALLASQHGGGDA